jgi:DNA-binding NtrC family response regulator
MSSDAPENTQSVTWSQGKSARVQVREWTLEIVGGPDKGKKVATLESLLRVGSDPGNDLVLSDSTVSRRHLEVERTGRGLLVKDLGSRNGTWVDGRQVMSAYVEPGDKITLGKTRLALKQQSKTTAVELMGAETFGELVGASESMRALFAELKRIAGEDMNVLIEGETGTGKELAARAIHQASARRNAPFRVVDCALIKPENADRELYGSEGAFPSAEGGTLFLDEVAELPLAVQPKLLRAIEAREVTDPGHAQKRQINARVIASTARNLEEETAQERFRKELFYRLAVGRIRLPTLRTRKSDIPLLAEHLLRRLGTAIALTPQTVALLEGYDWPGNVRELRNVLERGALQQQTGDSSWVEFLLQPTAKKKSSEPTSVGAVVAGYAYHEAKDRVLADFEKHYFAEVMKECAFDIKLAEGRTGLSMQSLYRLLKKNGLRIKDLKNAEGLG